MTQLIPQPPRGRAGPSAPTALPSTAVAALRRTVRGLVVYPADPAFAELVGDASPPPAAAVVVADEGDATAVVEVAAAHRLPLRGDAVVGPACTEPGGLLVLTHRLADVVLDTVAGVAVVGIGATWDGVAAVDRLVGRDPHLLGIRLIGADAFPHDLPITPHLGPGVVVAVRLALTDPEAQP